MKKLELTFTGWRRSMDSDDFYGHITANIESIRMYIHCIATNEKSQAHVLETSTTKFRKNLERLRDELNNMDLSI